MKRLIISIMLVGIAFIAKPQCQAWFSTSQDSILISMYDQSYNTDSTMINVTSWSWTLSGMGVSYTYNTQNPTELLSNLPSGMYVICLTIETSTLCTSTFCDSIYIGNMPASCNANFNYIYQGGGVFDFYDQSTASGSQSVISWDWTFTGGTPGASTQPDPSVTFPAQNSYQVTLQILTDSGCSDTYTHWVDYFDSSQCIYYIDADVYHVTTVNGNDGAIDITVYGGTPPYAFNWSNGATTEDIYGLTSGVYTVVVDDSDSLCPPYTATATVLEPYDSLNPIIDTLLVPAIDSCLNFIPDSFFIGQVITSGNIVSVEWIFTGAGQTATIWVDYTFANYGSQVVVLSITCDSAKNTVTYMSYIYIHDAMGVEESQIELSIYPIPANDIIQVNLSNDINVRVVRVFNSVGEVVKTQYTYENGVNVSDLPNGIYYLTIEGTLDVLQKQFVILR
ncbi:MAG: T9SS type A sorting domain-containing protein [Bacteroidales bacterium]|nr:T9SS type A sorting domain-containing protein [Bacteroidales bacterium]